MAAPAFDFSSLREAFRSKDTLIARLNALLDAVEAAKDGEARETALEAWAQEKSGIASRLCELVESKVGKDITKPLEDAGVGAGTRTPRDAPFLRPTRLRLHTDLPAEQAAATRRDAPEDHVALVRSNKVVFSLPRPESDVSRATTVPESPTRRPSTSGDSSPFDFRTLVTTPDWPVEELDEHTHQILSYSRPGDHQLNTRRANPPERSSPTPFGPARSSSSQHRRIQELVLQGDPASFQKQSSLPELSASPTPRFRTASISNTAQMQALAEARAAGPGRPMSPVHTLRWLHRRLSEGFSRSMQELAGSI
ncbi:hypothetical protein T484DRAFT_1863116 [Baffinella frigidus]|nr:hypothetical protein T484DRAFT_1863116 [Cryptophyta sp. CCMP2293]